MVPFQSCVHQPAFHQRWQLLLKILIFLQSPLLLHFLLECPLNLNSRYMVMGCLKYILGFPVTFVILQIFGKYANEVRIDH